MHGMTNTAYIDDPPFYLFTLMVLQSFGIGPTASIDSALLVFPAFRQAGSKAQLCLQLDTSCVAREASADSDMS